MISLSFHILPFFSHPFFTAKAEPPRRGHYRGTVETVYNGHPRDLRNWPLNTGSLKILTGRGLMIWYCTSILNGRSTACGSFVRVISL